MNHLDDLLVYRVEIPQGAIFPEYRQQPEATTNTVDYVRRDHARTAAFGAIRRAAEVARDADRCAEELWNEIDDPWEDSGAFEVWRFAAGCRAAIRAAIGSDKHG